MQGRNFIDMILVIFHWYCYLVRHTLVLLYNYLKFSIAVLSWFQDELILVFYMQQSPILKLDMRYSETRVTGWYIELHLAATTFYLKNSNILNYLLPKQTMGLPLFQKVLWVSWDRFMAFKSFMPFQKCRFQTMSWTQFKTSGVWCIYCKISDVTREFCD